MYIYKRDLQQQVPLFCVNSNSSCFNPTTSTKTLGLPVFMGL